jgi:hypothetical protein
VEDAGSSDAARRLFDPLVDADTVYQTMLRLPGMSAARRRASCIGICPATDIQLPEGSPVEALEYRSSGTTADIVGCDIDGDERRIHRGTTDGRLSPSAPMSGRGVIRRLWMRPRQSYRCRCRRRRLSLFVSGCGSLVRRNGRLTMRNVRIGTTAFLVEDRTTIT